MKYVKAIPSRKGIQYQIRFRYRCPEANQTVEFCRRFDLSRKEAEQLAVLLREAAQKGRLDDVLAMAHQVQSERVDAEMDGPTFGEFAEVWWEESVLGHKNTRRKPNSPMEQHVRRSRLDTLLLPALGDLRLRAIDAGVVEKRVLGRLLRGSDARNGKPYSTATIDGYRRILSAMFERAIKAGLVSSNPVREVEWPAVEDREMRFYDVEQADRFFAAATEYENGDYWFPLLFLVMRTGIRQGEVFGLEPKHLRLARRGSTSKLEVVQQLQFGEVCPPKWGRSRWVDLDDDVTAVMRTYVAWRESRFGPCRWLFPSIHTGKPVQSASKYVQRALRAIAASAGVPQITFHELRHSRASQLAQAGVDDLTIAQQLGHRDLRTTRRYTHLRAGAGAAAAAKVAALSSTEVPEKVVSISDYHDLADSDVPKVRRVEVPEDQQALLRLLVFGPQQLGDLAAQLPWGRTRLYRLVVIAERAGLVEKRRVESARHGVKLVRLTELGHDAIAHGMARRVEFERLTEVSADPEANAEAKGHKSRGSEGNSSPRKFPSFESGNG